jgi:hypothetical protein
MHFRVAALLMLALAAANSPSSAQKPAARELGKVRAEPARFADEDPNNDLVVAPPDPIADCRPRLDALGVKYRPSEIPLSRKRGATYTCGTEQAVLYLKGTPSAGRIKYSPAAMVSCRLALAMAEFEVVLQEAAMRSFGKRVRRIEQAGTYNCRRMVRFRDMVSEHSYANAIDIRSFVLEDGRRISVLADFGALEREPANEKGRFLRSLARRLYDDGVFSVVLTPYWDALHRDHFHLDLARYRVDGTR